MYKPDYYTCKEKTHEIIEQIHKYRNRILSYYVIDRNNTLHDHVIETGEKLGEAIEALTILERKFYNKYRNRSRSGL